MSGAYHWLTMAHLTDRGITCKLLILNGAEGQNRTGDTVIFSHVLYQLSYLGFYLRGVDA